jgi:hypothetical protein
MSGVRVTQEEIDRPGMRKKKNRDARRRRVARSISDALFQECTAGRTPPPDEYVQTYTPLGEPSRPFRPPVGPGAE